MDLGGLDVRIRKPGNLGLSQLTGIQGLPFHSTFHFSFFFKAFELEVSLVHLAIMKFFRSEIGVVGMAATAAQFVSVSGSPTGRAGAGKYLAFQSRISANESVTDKKETAI